MAVAREVIEKQVERSKDLGPKALSRTKQRSGQLRAPGTVHGSTER